MVRDESGLYAYAELDDGGKLVPSQEKVGRGSPKKRGAKKNLRPHQQDPDDGSVPNVFSGKRPTQNYDYHPDDFSTPSASLRGTASNSIDFHEPGQNRRRTATVGTLKNLVIMIKFRDHNRRTLPSRADVDVLMNSEEAHPTLAPTGSLKMVYWENSYGQLTIESTVVDWIRVSKGESYYADGQSGVGSRRLFQEALVEVLDRLESNRFDFSEFDEDGDSHIDSITFLTSGYGAEWGGGEWISDQVLSFFLGRHQILLFLLCNMLSF